MDSWVLKQLRACVLSELKAYIPEEYFEQRIQKLEFSINFKGHEYLSFENNWGYLAGKLGKKLYFESPIDFTPRQTSASELLMNLGMLASSKASLNACKQIYDKSLEKGISDGNSGNVVAQLQNEFIPAFEENIKGGLEQYLLFLTAEEAKPYLSLLSEGEQKTNRNTELSEDIIDIKPNFMGVGLNVNALYRKLFNNKT
jgi:hypothetical protein